MRQGRLVALLVWLGVVAAGLLLIARAQFSTDMSAFLPRSPDAQQRVLVDQLRTGLVSRLLMVGIDGADPQLRAEVSQHLAARLRRLPDFASVNNGQAVDAGRDYAVVFDHRYQLDAINASTFSAAGLRASIDDALAQLASPMGGALKHLFVTDPTGATLGFLRQVTPARQPRLLDGSWASPDGRRALLLAIMHAAGTDIDAQQHALLALRAAFAQAQREVGPAASATRLVVSGPAVFAVQSRSTIKSAVTRISLIGATLIVVLLWLVYRSVPVLVLGMLPVLTGIVVATAAVSLVYGVVQGLTLGFGTTLMGEAVDYSIYLFVQSGARADADPRAWLDRFWPTVRLGMLTSVIGFASLLLSEFPGLAQIGAYSMAGLVTAALVTRFVLPRLLPARFQVRDLSPIGERLLRVVRGLRRLRYALLVLVVAAVAVLLAQRHQLWNDRLAALGSMSQRMLDTDAQLRRQIGAPDSGDLVVVGGASQEDVLRRAEAIAPRLRALVGAGAIGGFDSPARYLPSARTQRARQALLPDAATIDANLAAAVAGLPVRPATFAPFVAQVQAARSAPLLTRADYAHTSLALALDGMLVHGADGHWSALLPLRAPASGAVDANRVIAALHGSDGTFVDLGATSHELYQGYRRTATWLSLAGVAAMALLLWLALRSLRRVARVLAPLLAAVVVVSAGLVAAGVQLNLLHLIGMMLVIAVGSNYALFFDRGATRGGIAPRTLASLVFANLTAVAGFGPLLLAGVPVLTALGATVAPGALLALLFSAILSAPTPDVTAPV